MRSTEGGFTLTELLLSLGVLAVVLATTATVLHNANAAVARTNAAAGGVQGLHRALERLERDIRGASRVEPGLAGAVRLVGTAGSLDWSLDRGTLRRRSVAGTETVASGISGFRVAPEDGLWRISLDLAGRGGEGQPRAGVTTLVGVRPGPEVR
jgi:prepilin-type N-terminal cleavage/methylation domain-containing protein